MALSLDFAFEGFRIIRERPRLIFWWGAVGLLGHAVAKGAMIHHAGPAVAQLQALELKGATPSDVAIVENLLRQILPGLAICLATSLVTGAILATAAARAALSPQDDRMGFLRLGMDELRMFAVHASMALMALVVLTVGAALGAISGEAGAATGMFAAGGVILSVAIRLSLNGPQSLDRKTLDLFGSFALTRPQIWRLIAGYVIAALLALAVCFLCAKVIMSIVTVAFGTIPAPDYSSLKAYLTPAHIAIEVFVGGVMVPLVAAIAYGAPAAAYRGLKTSTAA